MLAEGDDGVERAGAEVVLQEVEEEGGDHEGESQVGDEVEEEVGGVESEQAGANLFFFGGESVQWDGRCVSQQLRGAPGAAWA